MFGGYCSDIDLYLSCCEEYNDSLDLWTNIKSMKTPRCLFSIALDIKAKKLFVFGGFNILVLDKAE